MLHLYTFLAQTANTSTIKPKAQTNESSIDTQNKAENIMPSLMPSRLMGTVDCHYCRAVLMTN